MDLKILSAIGITLAGASTASAQDAGMSFFVTSENAGQGADFGGLSGADCRRVPRMRAPGLDPVLG